MSLAKKEFLVKNSSEENVYLESHRGRRSEPAGLHGLRKHVTEVKEGSWELTRKKAKDTRLREEGGKGAGVLGR